MLQTTVKSTSLDGLKKGLAHFRFTGRGKYISDWLPTTYPTGNVQSVATLVGFPRYVRCIRSGFTAATPFCRELAWPSGDLSPGLLACCSIHSTTAVLLTTKWTFQV